VPRSGQGVRPAVTVCAIVVVGAVLTLAVTLTPVVRFAYRSREAQVALETADGLAVAAVAFLFYGRVRRRPARRDLLLTCAMAVFAGADLIAATLSGVLREQPGAFSTWAPSWYRFLATFLLAGAALLPNRDLGRRESRGIVAVVAAAAAASAAGIALLQPVLPRSLDPILVPELSHQPRITGPLPFLAMQAVAAALLAATCIAFTLQAERNRDPLVRWLAAASALFMLARVNYFLFPSNVSEWFYIGDLFRLGFSILLLVGAAAEIQRYWISQAEVAVLDERRRLARDLHDGVVQELGYIRTQVLRAKRSGVAEPVLDTVLAATERGSDEARRAIAALTAPADEPLAQTFERAALELADRHGITVRCRTEPGVELAPRTREDVLRVLREATSNAARHGGAGTVEARLFRDGEAKFLVVTDDGAGFDPAACDSRGFGLTSMRDRAAGIGGRLEVVSRPGAGTVVRMEWP
jgi:signal transduction histidine kinase